MAFCLALAATGARAQEVYDLPKTLRRALTEAPAARAAVAKAVSSGLEEKNARAAFAPTLDLNSNHGLQGGTPQPASPYVSNLTLSLTQPIYDNGVSWTQLRIAEWTRRQAELALQVDRSKVVRDVAIAFLEYSYARLHQGLTLQSFEETKKQFEYASRLFHQGVKTRKDFTRLQSQAQRQELNWAASERATQRARLDLFRSMGLPPEENVEFKLIEAPTIPAPKVKEGEVQASKIYQIQRQIADAQIELVRRKSWPQLSLTGNAQYGSSQYMGTGQPWVDNAASGWSILLNMKYNFIDFGTRSRNTEIENLKQQQGLFNGREQVLSAENERDRLRADLVAVGRSRDLARQLQKLEEESFKYTDQEYRSGRMSYIELINDLNNLLDARERRLRAEFDFAAVVIQLRHILGVLNESDLAL